MVKMLNIQFSYPSNAPLSNQILTWVLVHPALQFSKDTDILTNICPPNSPLFGCWNQETRQISSPMYFYEILRPKYCQYQLSVESDFKLKPQQHQQKRKKKQKDEEEFRPNVQEIKKTRKTPQNSNRNVVPNIMHQVISYLQKKNKSQRMVTQMIEKLELQKVCSSNRFYCYQMLIKEKLNHYVNAQSLLILNELQEPLCEVYSKEEQTNYNKISRMLVHYFLSKQFDSIILTSKRVHSVKRQDHLRMKRKIVEQIMEMFQK